MRNLCEAISEKCEVLECKISRLEISERAELGEITFFEYLEGWEIVESRSGI